MVFARLRRVNPAGRKGRVSKSELGSDLGSVCWLLRRPLEVSWTLGEASLVVHSVIFKDAVIILHRVAPDLEHLSFPRVWDAVGSVLGVVRGENEVMLVHLFHFGSFQLAYEAGGCCLPSV